MMRLYFFYLSLMVPLLVQPRLGLKSQTPFLQQHQIPEDEAIRVAALHLGGKVYAWWLFESFTLKNENTSSYAMFIRTLIFLKREYYSPVDLSHHIREREKMKTPLYGEKREDKITKILPRSLLSIHEEFEKIRREICTGSPKGFEIESNSRFSCRGCEHVATPCNTQCSHMDIFAMRREEG